MDIGDSVLLALKLSLLTFYLGVLIYALPIPLASIKRWAPLLIVDSLFAFVLVMIHGALYYGSERLAVMLGGSEALFLDWMQGAYFMAASVKVLANVIEALPLKYGVSPFLQAIIVPFDRMATLALTFLTTLHGIALLVFLYGMKLIVVGLLLYSIPFRIAKGAGAWLMSFVVVFTVGLQLLPLFLSFIAPPPGGVDLLDYRVVSVRVTSSYGHPAASGILHFWGAEEEISHELDEEGYASSPYLAERIIALPAKPLTPVLEYAGHLFPLEPSPFDPRSRAGKEAALTAPHVILFRQPSTVIFVSSVTRTSLQVQENSYTARAWLEAGEYMQAKVPEACRHELKANGTVSKGRAKWRDVELKVYTLKAERSGWHEMSLTLWPCSVPLRPVEGSDYMDVLLQKVHYIDLNIMRGFILYYLTVPAMYTFVLFLITTGLAYLLGGRDRIPIRVA
ncbi:MAG: hypothetical protein N3F67_01310 [Acidilobaceae archaeon]|nr:hypothetical protein [Acidilobaceae archaeon]